MQEIRKRIGLITQDIRKIGSEYADVRENGPEYAGPQSEWA
jgi:hypothetical protein